MMLLMLENQVYRLADLDGLEGDYELDEGALVTVTRPTPRHGKVCARVITLLTTHCDQTGQGMVMGNDSGFVLGRTPDTLRGPDVAVVLADRAQHLDMDAWGEGAPDLVVEVISPSDRPAAIQRRISQYLDAGCQLVWVLYPGRRCAVVYDASGRVQVLGEDGELMGDPLLPGFRTPVTALFR